MVGKCSKCQTKLQKRSGYCAPCARAYAAKWRKKNTDYIKNYNSEWRKKNPDYFSEYNPKWKKNNPKKTRQYKLKWEAKKREAKLHARLIIECHNEFCKEKFFRTSERYKYCSPQCARIGQLKNERKWREKNQEHFSRRKRNYAYLKTAALQICKELGLLETLKQRIENET